MVRIAPRYDARIIEAVVALDDRDESIAEICRRIAADVEQQGITRPSYVHLRRLIQQRRALEDEAREHRKELLRIAADVYTDTMRSRVIDPWEVAERVRNA